jgi:hypothetical protein
VYPITGIAACCARAASGHATAAAPSVAKNFSVSDVARRDLPVGGHSCHGGSYHASVTRSVTEGDRQVLWMFPKITWGQSRT